MNELIRKLAKQADPDYGNKYVETPESIVGDSAIQKFAQLIINECEQVCLKSSHRDDDMGAIIARQIKQHFGIQTEPVEERKHIGYTEREEGFYKLYAPPQGSLVTQAFILCKYCSGAIYHCSGPKLDAVCFSCYSVDPELRGQA